MGGSIWAALRGGEFLGFILVRTLGKADLGPQTALGL